MAFDNIDTAPLGNILEIKQDSPKGLGIKRKTGLSKLKDLGYKSKEKK